MGAESAAPRRDRTNALSLALPLAEQDSPAAIQDQARQRPPPQSCQGLAPDGDRPDASQPPAARRKKRPPPQAGRAAHGAQNARGSARNAQARRTGARGAPAPKARWPVKGFAPALRQRLLLARLEKPRAGLQRHGHWPKKDVQTSFEIA